MNTVQFLTLILLTAFYAAYLVRMLLLRKQGIAGNLLGKGDKPEKELLVERLLGAATLAGTAVQFASAVFSTRVAALPVNAKTQATGVILQGCGTVFFVAALYAMQDNWRAGFTGDQDTDLVTHGVYRLSRNPAFVGFDLLYIGCAMACPNIVNIAAAAVAVILFHLQILSEEKYCAAAFGQSYQEYRARVRRYL
jgi:protein-S-isoprenylcysteine O-methyltransferase Ste14